MKAYLALPHAGNPPRTAARKLDSDGPLWYNQGHNQIFSDRKMGVYLSESGYPTSNIYPRIRITHPGPGIIRISGISGREKRLNWLEMSQFEMSQFRPNGQKTDMFRASEQQMDARNGIYGRFAVQNTLSGVFDWLEQRSDAIPSNFAVREY